MKKTLKVIFSLIFCIYTFVSVFSAEMEDFTCEQIGEDIVISGMAVNGTRVTVNIMPEGKTYEDLYNAEEGSSVLVYHDQVKAENNSFTFYAELETAGYYTAYVKIGEKDVKTKDFYYTVPKEENPVLFEANFEEKSILEYGFLFAGDNKGSSMKLEQKDTEHGMSVHLMQPNDASYLYKIMDAPQKDKTIMVEFSYYRESTDNLFFIRTAKSGLVTPLDICRGENTRTARQTYFSIDGSASVYRNGRSWSRPTETDAYIAEKTNDWNNVIIYYDFLHSEISYYLNGEQLYINEMNIDMPDFYGMCWCIYKGGDLWLDNIKITELTRAEKLDLSETDMPIDLWNYSNRPVDVSFNSGATGHIFENTPSFDVVFSERDGESGEFIVNYTVKDENLETVWTGSDGFSLEAYAMEEKRLNPEINKYGVYWLYADITSDTHNGYSAFTQFSLVNTPPDSYKNDDFGMVMHIGQNREHEDQLELVNMAGVGIVRDELYWNDIETSENVWVFPAEQVAYWKDLAEKGITFYFNLSYGGPSWRGAIGSDEYISGYEEWAYQMTKEFKDLGLNFMIGTYNEWNHNDVVAPETYVKMLKACYNGVKRADENVMVVGGETSGTPVDKIRVVLELLNGEKYMDAWSNHLYPGSGTQTPEQFKFINHADNMRYLLDQYGYSDIPMWLTETGWSTRTGWASEHGQAQIITRLMALSEAEKLWDTVFWYDFQNDGSYDSPHESNFGIIETFMPSWNHPEPMAAKPAYLAYANYNALLYDAEFSKKINLGSNVIGYLYNKDDKKVLYAVATSNKSVKVYADCNFVTIYDMYGNAKQVSVSDGVLTLVLTQDPVYIEGRYSDIVLCDVGSDFTIDKMTITKNNSSIYYTNSLKDGDVLSGAVKVTNNTSENKPCWFVFAVYDNQSLCYVKHAKTILTANELFEKSFNYVISDEENISVKIFIWDDMMRPYREAKIVKKW